jgi:asparagine synthase (glutamine-hydrolysing)
MCGINGFTANDKIKIEKMNKALEHRGPDYAGIYLDQDVSFGHLLLSIRADNTVSKQPYKDNPDWVLLFNGQIYNTEFIKKTYLQDIHIDPEHKELDTYILYKLIEKYGWDFISKIHGMFAIALYHVPEKKLRLYRDPSGQKLLYYALDKKTFVFSSEIKGLIDYGIIPEADAEAISFAATVGYMLGEKTILKGVSKLEPSQCVTYDVKAGTVEKTWFKSESDNYYPDNVDDAFQQLIVEHLQSKQKIALNLSGGLDSSALLYEMSRAGHSIHSYTTFFNIDGSAEQSKKYNTDAVLAKRLAEDFKAIHTEITVSKKEYIENFIESYACIEEPNYNISLPVYLLTAKTEGIHGAGNRVVLSGDGGDELFGGYPSYLESQKIQSKINKVTPVLYNFIRWLRDGSYFNYANAGERWYTMKQLPTKLKQPENKAAYRKYVTQALKHYFDIYKIKSDPVYELMLVDRVIWLASENFIRSDKLYMSQSMEMRCPLSYHPFRMYIDKKLTANDYISESENKIFMRKHYEGKLPDYIVHRPEKTGWRAPVDIWYDQEVKNMFLSIIGNRQGEIVDWDGVRALIAEKESWPGKVVHFYLSLALLADRYKLTI